MWLLFLLLGLLSESLTHNITTRQTDQGSPASPVVTSYGCEDTTVRLHCQAEDTLRIVRANYGRFSISVCNPLAVSSLSTTCGTELVTSSLLSRMCSGLSTCTIPVTSPHLPPSPCPGTPSYLEVQYWCQTKDTTQDRLARLPRLENNITLWDKHERELSQGVIEEAIRRGKEEVISSESKDTIRTNSKKKIIMTTNKDGVDKKEVMEGISEKEEKDEPIMTNKDDVEEIIHDKDGEIPWQRTINRPKLEKEIKEEKEVKKRLNYGNNPVRRKGDEPIQTGPSLIHPVIASISVRERKEETMVQTAVSETSHTTVAITVVSSLVSLCCLLTLSWITCIRHRKSWQTRQPTKGPVSSPLSCSEQSEVSSVSQQSCPGEYKEKEAGGYHGGHDTQCHCQTQHNGCESQQSTHPDIESPHTVPHTVSESHSQSQVRQGHCMGCMSPTTSLTVSRLPDLLDLQSHMSSPHPSPHPQSSRHIPCASTSRPPSYYCPSPVPSHSSIVYSPSPLPHHSTNLPCSVSIQYNISYKLPHGRLHCDV